MKMSSSTATAPSRPCPSAMSASSASDIVSTSWEPVKRCDSNLPQMRSDPVLDELVDRACTRTGLDDFGPDPWREGLAVLVQSCESTAGVIPSGRDDLYAKFVDALSNRLRVLEYAKKHPEIAEERVERPLIV